MEGLGIDKERLQLLWASAAEGARIASKIREMQATLNKLTPEEVEKAKAVFAKSHGRD